MIEANKKLFDEFIREETISGRRPGGIRILKQKTKILISYLEEMKLSLNEVGVREAQAYQGYLIERGRLDGGKYVNSSIKPNITAAVSLYDYLKRKGFVLKNPFKDIHRVRIEKVLPRNLLKEKEMDLFLKELRKFGEEKIFKQKITRYKHHVVSELMYGTGLRISEVANLKVNDIDFERGLVNVIEGKQGISRVAFLNEYAKEILRIYIKDMREIIFNDWNKRNGNDSLFGVRCGNLDKELNKLLKTISDKLKLPKFTSHTFRHCLGYHLLRAGCDIRFIQGILGHRCLKNTEVYTKVDKEDLKEALDKYHPRTLGRGKYEDPE